MANTYGETQPRARRSQDRTVWDLCIAAAALGLCILLSSESVAETTGAARESAPAAHHDSHDAARFGAPRRGIAMHGAPALEDGFAAFPYAEPTAPKGGVMRLGERGTFDSLNPYLTRGRAPWALREHVIDTMMARSYDEPFSLYGLIAERIAVPDDRSSVTFFLNPAARFSTSEPVTIDDVIWTFETLRDHGRPSYGSAYGRVRSIERVGDDAVRFVFEAPDRELPLLIGLMPVLAKSAYEGRDFRSSADVIPIAAGPYVVDRVEMGRSLRLTRDPDYWAADLGVNRGRHNADVVDVQFIRDDGARWEAFTAGAIDLFEDGDPSRWENGYDFPRALSGDVVQSEITNARPSGMRGFVFNTRRPLFADRRVREAIALAFDWEWLNDRAFAGRQTRRQSTFSGSELGFRDPIDPAARALLAPFAGALPAGTLEQGWRPPIGAGDGRNRRNLRAARRLLEEAGWTVRDGVLTNADGEPFVFEILLSSSADERAAAAFADNLAPLGVEARRRLVDSAQYVERITDYDYDMIVRVWAMSLSPGAEQRFYWGSYGRETPGTRNYMGVADPVVDAMIDALLAAEDRSAFVSAVRALDRVLASGVYVVPLGRLETQLIAHSSRLRRPERDALYGFWPDVWPDVWWLEPQ